MKANKYEDLRQAVLRAIDAAKVFADSEDGGTCNLDNPTFDWTGMQKAKVLAVLKSCGLRSFDWYGKTIVVGGVTRGMGNRRTRMAEAFSNSMMFDGYNSSMYYQMD